MSSRRELWELKFDVVRSIRYHDYRRREFDIFNKVVTYAVLLCSSGAALNLVGQQSDITWALWLSAIAAALSLANIALSSATKIALYGGLKNKYSLLLAKIEDYREVTDDQLRAFKDEYQKIEIDEPSVSDSLNRIAYNMAVDAVGLDTSNKRPVHWRDYILAIF